ncbi:MAG: SRPBCC family protein [Bacteroidetes bacterium]|nr:SRPBCC family protein [Bacteroidota bacterium]
MLHKIESCQHIKSDIDTAWEFISSPNNLAVITPSYMNFKIINETKPLDKMSAGQIIEYTVTPALGIKIKWVTEITHVEHNYYFVDEQRFGPYAFWHHKHFLKQVDGGIEMADIVHYRLPFGFLGRLVNSLFVKKQLKEIFAYRHQKVEELFNSKK